MKRKSALVLFSVIVFFGVTVGFIYFFLPGIERIVVQRKINDLARGRFSLTIGNIKIFRNGILLRDSTVHSRDADGYIGSIRAYFSVWNFIFGNHYIEKITFKNGQLHIKNIKKQTAFRPLHHSVTMGKRLFINKILIKDITLNIRSSKLGPIKAKTDLTALQKDGSWIIKGSLLFFKPWNEKASVVVSLKHGIVETRLSFKRPMEFHSKKLSLYIKSLHIINDEILLSNVKVSTPIVSLNAGAVRLTGLRQVFKILRESRAKIDLGPLVKTISSGTNVMESNDIRERIKNLIRKATSLLGLTYNILTSIYRSCPPGVTMDDVSLHVGPFNADSLKLNISNSDGVCSIKIYRADSKLIDLSMKMEDQDIKLTISKLNLPIPFKNPHIIPGDKSRFNIQMNGVISGDLLNTSLNLLTGPLGLNFSLLSEDSLSFQKVMLNTGLKVTPDSIVFNNAILGLNNLRLLFNLRLQQDGGFSIDLHLPKTKAEDIIHNLPDSLTGIVSKIQFAGTFEAKLSFKFNALQPQDSKLHVWTDTKNLQIVKVPKELDPLVLTGDFVQVIQEEGKEPIKRMIGPDAPDWVSLQDIPPYFVDCLLASEDITFMKHHGFSLSQIKDALVLDLTTGQIKRGASTITQQLVKNLFLSRVKNLSRKLQEAVLTWYIEQTLPKEKILELYLNIIEWGPDIYGLKAASLHYFGKEPQDLDLSESAFLVSIIPNPVHWHDMCIALKRVPKAIQYRMNHIFRVLLKNKVLDQDVINDAMQEKIEFNPQMFEIKRSKRHKRGRRK